MYINITPHQYNISKLKMEIKKSTKVNGLGLFAKKSVKQGDIIFVLTGQKLNHPTRESIHIGDGVHIVDEYGMFINHSFTPSAIISNSNVVANIDISEGDEITFNYNDSELEMACPFESDGKLVSGQSTSG